MDTNFKPYTDFNTATGSASVSTVELSKIRSKSIVFVDIVTATIFTTVHGDYTTAKYINIYLQRGSKKFYLKGKDIGTSATVIQTERPFIMVQGDKIVVEFEGTAISTTYEVVLLGKIVDFEL